MEYLNGYIWIVPLIISVVAIIKVISQVVKNSNKKRYVPVNQNAGTVVRDTVSVTSSFNETGPIVYFANDNHHQGDNEYRFNYKKVSGSWRAYIIKMPSLKNRDQSGLVTHRLFDNGQPYVCWDSPVNTLKDMQTISKVWADNIQEYIATGKRFG